MKIRRGVCLRLLLVSLTLLIMLSSGRAMAQVPGPYAPVMFNQEQLDQMLAPIALYPDELLVQVLMAATYPLEVTQAAQWVQVNAGLNGDQLAIALEQQNWDPSVKSLVNFPPVLQMMSDRLDWTQQLGDAFLGQEEQVMATVQQLRLRARQQGNLVTTNEQDVMVDPETQQIIIQPVAPQVVYVPVYDPMVVYGPWWWPAYRPYFYHPRGVVVGGGIIGFGLGIRIGVPWGYAWGGFNWHRHDVVVNVQRNVQINNHIDRNRYVNHVTASSSGQGTWRHDPVHRQGVAYRSPSVAEQYGRGPRPGVETRRDYRGFEQPRPAQAQARPEQPRQPAPAPQPRVTPAPPVQQPHPAPAPQARPEQPREPAPAPQPRVTPAPQVQQPHPAPAPQARPETPPQQVGPARAAPQRAQGPTTFGGSGQQVRQFSNRGRESLGGTPPGQAPAANRPAKTRSSGRTSRWRTPRWTSRWRNSAGWRPWWLTWRTLSFRKSMCYGGNGDVASRIH